MNEPEPRPYVKWDNPTLEELFNVYHWAKNQEDYHERTRIKIKEFKESVSFLIAKKTLNKIEEGESTKIEGNSVRVEKLSSPTIKDWAGFLEWVVENERWDMLTREVKTTVIKQYFADNFDYPPGIGTYQRFAIRIKKLKNGDDNDE